jgi:hypothetical protein
MPENTLFTLRTGEDGEALYNPVLPLWNNEHKVTIDRFSNGDSAIAQKGYGWTNLTQVASAWNDAAICFYFECWHSLEMELEPAAGASKISNPETEAVTLLLRPEGCEDYFEISVDSEGNLSSTHVLQPPDEVDQAWDPLAEVKILHSETEKIWRAFLRLPYGPLISSSSLGDVPEVGDAWRLNLHRRAGHKDSSELLSWRPSYNDRPDFLVSGHLIFLGAA